VLNITNCQVSAKFHLGFGFSEGSKARKRFYVSGLWHCRYQANRE